MTNKPHKTTPSSLFFIIILLFSFCTSTLLTAKDQMKSGVDKDGIVHVRVWDLPDSPGNTTASKSSWQILKAFEKKYPSIRLHPATGISLPGLGSTMDIGPLMAISGGIAPDILYVNFRKSASYIDDEFLYPLDDYMSDYRKRVGEKEFAFRINKALFPVITRKGPLKGKRVEKTWMMPEFPLVMMMQYRRDLFLKNGISDKEAPKNWEELFDICVKLTNDDEKTFGIALQSGAGAAWNYMNFLSSTGTRVVTQSEQGVWHATFATEGAAKALRLYKKLVAGKRPDGTGRGYSTSNATFKSQGRVGMAFSYLGGEQVSNIESAAGAQWGFAPVPMGPTGIRSAEINAKMWGIFRGQKNKKVRDAAWKWLEFKGSLEARRILIDTLINNNETRAIHPAILNNLCEKYPEYEKYKIFINKEIETMYNSLTENATPEPYGKNCDLVYDYLDKPLQRAITWERQGKFDGMGEEEELAILLDMLKEFQELAEIEMIQNLPEEEKSYRNKVAFFVCLFIFAAFFYVFYKVYKVFTPEHERGKGWQFKKYSLAYIILIPACLTIFTWQYFPLIRGSLMAFQDYKIAVPNIQWVGLDNFAAVIFDQLFWQSIWLSIYYTLLLILFTWLPPVLLAIMLAEINRGTVFFRVVFYLPAIVSGLIIIFLWKALFDPSPQGMMNQLVEIIGMDQQYWFEDPHMAMFCLILPLAWAHTGPGCLIYLAALKGIPDDMYEAADLDGASYWQKIIHIVFPKLRPLLTIALIGQVIAGFQAADNVLVMTGGGPDNATMVTGLLIFKKAFVYTKYGVATSMAWITGVFLITFTIYQLKILSRLEFKTTGN